MNKFPVGFVMMISLGGDKGGRWETSLEETDHWKHVLESCVAQTSSSLLLTLPLAC